MCVERKIFKSWVMYVVCANGDGREELSLIESIKSVESEKAIKFLTTLKAEFHKVLKGKFYTQNVDF